MRTVQVGALGAADADRCQYKERGRCYMALYDFLEQWTRELSERAVHEP